MNIARAFISSIWTSLVVLASLFGSSIAAAWTGLETNRALEDATTEGVFAISTSLEHTSLWNAAIVLVALPVLIVPAGASGAAGPSKREG